MHDRRQFSRVLFHINAALVIDNQIYKVSIDDISLHGVLITDLQSKTPLQGKSGRLSFFLSDDKSEVSMDITMIHETGLQCDAIDIDSVTHLRRLIELNLGDTEQIDKELYQLSHCH